MIMVAARVCGDFECVFQFTPTDSETNVYLQKQGREERYKCVRRVEEGEKRK